MPLFESFIPNLIGGVTRKLPFWTILSAHREHDGTTGKLEYDKAII